MPGLRDEQRIREDVFLGVSELIFQETVASTVKDEVTEILDQVQLADHSTITVADNFVAECSEETLDSERVLSFTGLPNMKILKAVFHHVVTTLPAEGSGKLSLFQQFICT